MVHLVIDFDFSTHSNYILSIYYNNLKHIKKVTYIHTYRYVYIYIYINIYIYSFHILLFIFYVIRSLTFRFRHK